MADGSTRSKENPFSFKSFLRNNSDGDTSPNRHRKKDNGSEDSENPFSFRKFLNQGKSPEVRYPQSRATNANSDSSNEDESFVSTLPLRASALPTGSEYHFSQELPDFIQDRLEQLTESKSEEECSSNIKQHSPDDTYCYDFHNSPSNGDHLATSAGSFGDTFAVENGEGYPESKNKSRLTDETIYSIPDFISSTQRSDSILPCSFEESNSTHSKTSLDDEVYALREENMLLQRQLKEVSENSEYQLSRIAELEDKLNELTDKETQETVALEKMVQQVEHNLQVTTERAIKAEAQVLKLKQEMKLLQAQLKTMAKENERINSSCSLVERDVVAAKADSIALQIKTAADNAEQPLRTMIEGLENLRFLSNLVADIGKIEEAK